MASFNNVTLVGNITRDIELRHVGANNTAVTDIGLAVNERVKRGDSYEDETSFFDCTLWGRTAEIANEYLGKGSSILVNGRLKQETWEKDGQKRSKVKIIVNELQMLGKKGERNEHNQEQPKSQQDAAMNQDVPF